MGRDKAELIFAGQSLLDRTISLLESIGSERILISGREGFSDSVPDILSHCGPPGGLHACLETLFEEGKLKDHPLLIVPLDMPYLNESVLKILLSNMAGESACHFEGEVLPCALRASVQLREHLRELFLDSHELGGLRSMRAILEFCHSRPLSKQSLAGTVFKNINTPEDYENSL
tara:strand:+ start:117362 stop:117886 length:525 start_codon:yes stop_codon:yes gene_type:complete